MKKITSLLIIGLSLIVLSVLVTAIYYTALSVANACDDDILENLSLLPAIVLSSGVLVAIITFSRERKKQQYEQERHTSEIMLNRAIDGFQTVIKLLSDKNNSRTTWVRAARTLLKSTALKNKITSEDYLVAYEMEEERVRSELYTILTVQNPSTGERDPLPPQFFYGIEDWKTCKTLDDAAIKSSSNAVAYSVTINEVPPQPFLKPLSVKTVIAIFDFLEFPKDTNKELEEIEDWDENWADSHGIDQGARRYVQHTKEKFAIEGKLHERTKNNS
ncbi:MAG: hypothetical protein JAZ17_03570 [Candidatus Thiodiazotropha endolucinida]|nr:hypothetical protein [Candidatus Thiodiazotropha endolucinida]